MIPMSYSPVDHPLSPADGSRKRPSPANSSVPNTPSSIPPPTTPHATTFTTPERRGSKSSNGGGPTISRSIAACNRCRARKTRCDQQFPSCSACLKAQVHCVGIDAATGREIPRSYVDWLEKRVKHLEDALKLEGAHGVGAVVDPQLQSGWGDAVGERNGAEDKALHLRPDIENLVNQVGVVGVQGTSAQGFMGGTSGISFARLMFSAVKLTSKDHEPTFTPSAFPRPPDSVPNPDAAASSTAIPRNRPRPLPCQFPPRPVAEQLLEIYFQQANPQFPILFRPTFINIFHRLCDRVETEGSASPENYAHGNGGLTPDRVQHSADLYFAFMCFAIASAMSQSSENMPERYHASAMQHLDALFMSVSFSNNRLDGLKGVLLLAVYSMMRPGIPGVWYVVGAALRLAVDLGLHNESAQKADKHWDPVQLDERRRLFWCTYSVDRQVSVYLGRPFGIADDAIKVPFPLDVDDDLITPSGIRHPAPGTRSSRTISLHMFRIRQLQSEIQQVLYQTSSVPRQFPTLDIWLHDMSARLTHWHTTAPKTPASAGCTFNLSFLDLNYEQTRLLLHGLCPAIPHPSTESFHIIADSGSKIIKSYRHLHREKSINYTWLACHNLFMAGTSYLCALWQSLDVRAATTIDEIDFHTLACIDVLSSMVERCPAAQTCRDVFESLAANTVHLCSNEYAALRPDPRPVKRFKAETEWCPPASIANLLHHPQSYEMAYPDQVDVMAGMDGSRLFEMIQEVGSGGNAGYGIGGYDGVWGLDAWVGAQGALMGGF